MHTKSGRMVSITLVLPALKEKGAGKYMEPCCEDKAEYWIECALDKESSPARIRKAVNQLRALTPKVEPGMRPLIEETLRRVEKKQDGRQEN